MADAILSQDSQNRISKKTRDSKDTDAKVAKTVDNLRTGKKTTTKVNYTLFASGLNYGGRNVELKDKNYKDDIAIIFDAVISHELQLDSTKTSYPIESKAERSDHIINKDGKFTFKSYVNTSPMYIIDKNYIDQDTNPKDPVSSKRPQKAYEALVKMRDQKQTVTLVTEDFILEDYILTGLSTSRESTEGGALMFDITLEEYRVVEVGKVRVPNTVKSSMQKKKSEGAKNGDSGKDLTFTEMKSPVKTSGGKRIEDFLQRQGITVPKVDAPAGVIKPDGTVVRN